MTISQIVELSKNSDLLNLPINTNNKAIIGFINLALIELYKRFPLKVSEHLIELETGKTIYDLPTDYMWIVAAYQEVDENLDIPYLQVPINEEDNPASVNTIGWNKIQIPVTTTGAFISIIYVASPITCLYDDTADINEQFYYIDEDSTKVYTIPIPPQMVEALLEYVAYKANKTLGVNGQAEGNIYYQTFETSCQKILQLGMFSIDDLDMTARDLKGFA